ncbi:MAG TPA: dihydropteroate synthase [Acidimicrobiales bacterium]|nr:dihydropteroate synthase [Acidimicrobiales bacterium]
MRLCLGSRAFDVTTRALVMGLLDCTTDSQSGIGPTFDIDGLLFRAEQLIADGADVLEVGGGSGALLSGGGAGGDVDLLIAAVGALTGRFDVPVSVGAGGAGVARDAFRAGASVANDATGFADPEYLAAAANAGASVVATHVGAPPQRVGQSPVEEDLVAAMCDELVARGRRAEDAGISPERIMVDAGVDLGKTAGQSAALLRASNRLAGLGWPLVVSASNAAFVGAPCELDIDAPRDAALSAAALGVALGARIVRTRDVRGARRVCDTVGAVLAAT